MIEVIPAIIAKNFQELEEKISKVKPFVDWAQLDIMDGGFVENVTWNNPKELPKLTENCSPLKLEAHLMAEKPEEAIGDWIKSGVKRIIFHYEATGKHQEIIDKIHNAGLEAGIAINPETSVEVLDKFMCHSRPRFHEDKLCGNPEILSPISDRLQNDKTGFPIKPVPDSNRGLGMTNMVLIMSVHPGKTGQKFLEETLPKIKNLRGKYPNVKIGVDGGINLETAGPAIQAGADVLFIGSGIFEGDVEENIKLLKHAIRG